jgi:putative ATPase
MIEAGEDPKFIARRLVILASEDVGLADSRALSVATDAFRAVELIGLPEAVYALSHATLYLALAPKSNTVKTAINRTRGLLERTPGASVPPHLRSAATEAQRALGDGVGYAYPHDDPDGILAQQYLPDGVTEATVYLAGTHGEEAELGERLTRIDRRLGKPKRK